MSDPLIGHGDSRLIEEVEKGLAVEVILIDRVQRETVDQFDDHLKENY